MSRSATLALALCLQIGFGAISPLPASAQESEAEQDFVEGKIQEISPDGTLIVLADKKGRYSLTGDAARQVQKDFTDGILPVGGWVRITFAADRSVAKVTRIEEPKKGPVVLNPRMAANERTLLSLKPNEKFELDGKEAIFVSFTNGQLLFEYPGDKHAQVKNLKQIGTVTKLTPIDDPGGAGDPGTDEPNKIKPGTWWRINGEYGFVIDIRDPITFEVYKGPRKKIAHAEIRTREPAQPPNISTPVSVTGTAVPAGPEEFPVQMAPINPVLHLDWNENVWKIPATVFNKKDGYLLIGGRIEVTFKGQYGESMVPPKVEDEMAPSFPSDHQEGTLTFQGTSYVFKRGEGTNLVAAPRSSAMNPTKVVSVPLTTAIFPGFPDQIVIRSDLMDSSLDRPPRVVFDEKKHLIPFTDEKALQHLIKAYHEHSDRRAAALTALAASKNPKVLPTLLWELYGEAGETPTAGLLKKAIGHLPEAAEDFLLGLLKDKAYEKPLKVINDQGAIEEKKPARSELLLVRIIEILDLIESPRAFTQILGLLRSTEEIVAQTAQKFFLNRAHPDPVVIFLAGKLAGELAPQAGEVMFAVEMKHPGALSRFIADSIKDTDNEALKRAREDLKDIPIGPALARKQIEFIAMAVRAQITTTTNLDPTVWAERDYLQRVGAELEQISTLRRDLARDYATQAVGVPKEAPDARARKMSLLRRALALDPTDETARTGFARIHAEMGKEVRKAEYLRAGPGDEYPIVRTLRSKESFTEIEPAAGAPETPGWFHVKGPDAEGWINAAVAIPGRKVIVVLHERRPLDLVRKFFDQARMFDPERAASFNADLAEIVADMAEEASAIGETRVAYDRLREAESLAPGKYTAAIAKAYLRDRPEIAALGVIALLVLIGAFVVGSGSGRRSSGGPRPPPPPSNGKSATAPAREPAAASPPPAPSTKKVPS